MRSFAVNKLQITSQLVVQHWTRACVTPSAIFPVGLGSWHKPSLWIGEGVLSFFLRTCTLSFCCTSKQCKKYVQTK